MISRKEFYYLRHGQTIHNALNLCTEKDEDPNLTPLGVEQANSVKKHICQLPIQTICHSPRVRAIQTMQIATPDLPLPKVEIHTLSECEGPIWENMTTNNHTPNVLSFYEQTITGINAALEHPGPVLIVAHGGIHWALCAQLQIQDHIWDIDNCQLVHFRPHNDTEWKAAILN